MKRFGFLIPENVRTLELLRICKKLYNAGYRKYDVNEFLIGVIIMFDYTDFDPEVVQAIFYIMSDLEK